MLVTDATGEHEIVLEDPALGEQTRLALGGRVLSWISSTRRGGVEISAYPPD